MIERLGNGRYKARLFLPGGKERSRTFDLRRDASEWYANQQSSRSQGTWVDPRLGKQTFARFADEWAAAQDTWKDTTVEAWPPIRARLINAGVGDVPLRSFEPLTIQRLRADLAKRYAPATVKQTMAYAGKILRAAHQSRRIGFDPTAGVRAQRARADELADRVGPDDVPTRAEMLAILQATADRYRAAVALGMTGLRIGEVLGMTVDRLDLAARLVTIDRQAQTVGGRVVLTTPKAEKVRTIKIPSLVAVELRRHVRDRPEGPLFPARVAGGLMRRSSFYDSAWHGALRRAGMCASCVAAGRRRPAGGEGCECAPLDFRFHACRHWCASTMLAERAPLTAVAGHLGDTVETVSRVYAHWLRDDRDIPAEVLDRVFALELPASTRPANAGGP